MNNKENNIGVEQIEATPEIEVGDVKISSDVVSAIAAVATTEISGIYGMAQNITGGIAELLGKKNVQKGIKVEVDQGIATIDAYIIIQYGAVIPEVAQKLQEKVKSNVETMTGLSVYKVNVHVQGVNFETNEPLELIDDQVQELQEEPQE